ncbi:RTA1-domain-containing protein [Aspergillus japonicus CBS 114.51]|uniref:RTA1-domain-containing protein n=1 Tax=Aspergillus japonicus CBS 114.51 TaxID=1448312 RepID=A0A8T8WL66_ASPJA|nr:RTA1-domain-containing protein [Aspergillus japonicus CBS 114.51]RAH76588.1 RTA1-domain-containing protein [Aspergillus japonicus CBS 114.51]
MPTYLLYQYAPSLPAAIAATVCFGLLTISHAIHYCAQRTWFFTPFIIGGIFETTGYTGRIINSTQTPNWTTAPYIMQSLLLLVAPSLFAASIYMILARIIRLTDGDTRSVLPAHWITRVFVVGDVLAFLAQAGGGGLLAKSNSSTTTKTANWIVITGLAIQIVFFAAFILVSAIFHRRMRSHPTRRARRTRVPWSGFLWVLYLTNALILGRSVFRVVEFAMGRDGVLQRREVWLYVFDGGVMALVMLLLLVWHPSRLRLRGGGRGVVRREWGGKKRRKTRKTRRRMEEGDLRGGWV